VAEYGNKLQTQHATADAEGYLTFLKVFSSDFILACEPTNPNPPHLQRVLEP
jgi:hypothetical protein